MRSLQVDPGGSNSVPLEDAPDARRADRELVVAPEVHRDLGWAEVVVLPKVEDLSDNLGLGGIRTHQRPMRAFAQALRPQLLVPQARPAGTAQVRGGESCQADQPL